MSTKKQIVVSNCSVELWKRLNEKAKEFGLTRAAYCRLLMEKALDKKLSITG